VHDRYQLGAKVAGSVACRWIERWIGADAAGDTQAAQQAIDAMATSRRWAILVEMDADGDYPEALWELADATATGNQVSGGERMTVQASYANTLGCTTRYYRPAAGVAGRQPPTQDGPAGIDVVGVGRLLVGAVAGTPSEVQATPPE